jgi:hypothetical protein
MSEAATPTLTDFLLARIAEDEAVAVAYRDGDSWGNPYAGESDGTDLDYEQRFNVARVQVECAAKRRIVERCSDPGQWADPLGTGPDVLRLLANVYADHPDYRQEWEQ